MDKRWKQLGEILVSHSAGIKPGEKVMIAMQETHTLPLVQKVYEESGTDRLGTRGRSLWYGVGGCLFWAARCA